MSLKLDIKSSDVLKDLEDKIKKSLEDDLKKVTKTLSVGALREAEKLSQKQLPDSLNNIYKQNLYIEKISDTITVVGIRKDALWIEEGRKSGFMEELLQGKGSSQPKTSKDGDKYRVIPFEKSTKGTDLGTSGQDLTQELKKFLKGQGIRYSKTRGLALDDKGSPRIGRIHSFNIKDMKKSRKSAAQNLSRELQGVSVYQNMNPKTGKVERNIMTFRVISEKHRGTGKWEHPGRPAENILEDAYKWVQSTWEKEILPELRKKYESR